MSSPILGFDPNSGRPVKGYDPNTGLPVYADAPPQKPQAAQPSAPASPSVPMILNDRTADAGLGAAKNIGQHAINLARFVNSMTGGKLSAALPEDVRQAIHYLEPHLTAASPAQRVGQATESTAEIMAPMGAVSKAGAAADLATQTALRGAPRAVQVGAGMAARAGVDAGVSGLTAAAQGNNPTAAVVGGAVGSLGAQALAKAAPALANRVENVLMKPTGRDMADGFVPSNVFKYKLGGSLGDTLKKGRESIADLTNKLQSVLRNSPNDIDLVDVLNQTSSTLKQNAMKTFGSNEAIERAVDDFFNEIAQVAPSSGKANMLDANKVKQAVGEFGAWLHDPSTGKTADAAVRAKEMVANAYYDHLKKAIENSSGNTGMVKLLNKQLSDIIPVVNAVIRRIPIEQRNNIINLGDMAGIGSGSWGLMMANRLLRSGKAANVMANTPQNASSYVAQGLGQTLGAAMKGGGE